MNELTRKVRKSGMRRNDYVRQVLAGIEPKDFPPIEYFEVLKHLREINVSMNQIAVAAKKTGDVNNDSYWNNVDELQKVYALLKTY